MPNLSTRRRFLATLCGLPVIWGVGDDTIPLIRRGNRVSDEALSDSPSPPETLWEETYGRYGGDLAHSVIETSDGGYLFAGYSGNNISLPDADAYLVKTDTGGTTLWEKRYGDRTGQDVNTVIETSMGDYLLAGEIVSDIYDEPNAWLVKVDTTGNIRWEQTFSNGNSQAKAALETEDGDYLVAGNKTQNGSDRSDIWLLKLNTDGTTQWEQTYGSSEDDWANSVIETSDGGYLLAGGSVSNRNLDALLMKVDTTGTTQWEQTYGGSEDDWANSVIETSDGSYLFASQTKSTGNGEGDAWLVKVNPDGTVRWEETFGGSATDYARSVIETSNGNNLFVGGTASSGNAKEDGWVVKIDTQGNTHWEQTYGGSEHDWGESIIETSDGGYLLAGATRSTGDDSADAWLLKAGELNAETTPSNKTPTDPGAGGTNGGDDMGDDDGISPSTEPTSGNGNGSSGVLFPLLGAVSVGWVIGFIPGNVESKKIRRKFLNLLVVGFGGVGLFGLIRWFLSPGGDEAALLVAALMLGLFVGMIVGIYARKRGITISTTE